MKEFQINSTLNLLETFVRAPALKADEPSALRPKTLKMKCRFEFHVRSGFLLRGKLKLSKFARRNLKASD